MEHLLQILVGAGKLLPATVVAAIVLFTLKEWLEAKRRKAANARKRRVVRRLIADEIERNNWTIKSLRDGIFQIERYILEKDSALSIREGYLGQRYLRREERGELASQFPITTVHTEVLSANLMTLAEIDEAIFEKALEANDAMKELDHVVTSMIEHVSSNNDRGFLEGFADYAKKEIEDCEKTLQDLYKTVTGRELDAIRVR